MTFGDRIVGAMKLDPNAFEDVERDPTAIGQSVGVIALAAVAAGIGNIYYGGLTGIVGGAFMSVISFLIWSLIIWLVGTKVLPEPATKADYPETFRVLGFAAAPGLASVITIIPLLGWLLMFVDLDLADCCDGHRGAPGAGFLDDRQGHRCRHHRLHHQYCPHHADHRPAPRDARALRLSRELGRGTGVILSDSGRKNNAEC